MMPWIGVLRALPALWLAAGDTVDSAVASTVEVRAVGMKCPSPADVAQRIGPLLPARTAFQPSDWIELSEVPSRRPGVVDVEVRLARAGVAAPLGVRRIERAGNCNEVADAIAVVAASWIGEFALPAPAVPALPPEGDPGASPPEALARPAERAAVPATVRASAPVATLASPAPIDARSANAFALGGFGGVLTGGDGGAAGVFGLEGELRRPLLLARLAFSATGTRELPLASARASWQRLAATIVVGTDLWRRRGAFLDATVGPTLALITARGLDLAVSDAPTGLDIGFAPSVRVGRSFFREAVVGWAAVGGALWLRDRILTVEGDPETLVLPRFEVILSVGITFFPGR